MSNDLIRQRMGRDLNWTGDSDWTRGMGNDPTVDLTRHRGVSNDLIGHGLDWEKMDL